MANNYIPETDNTSSNLSQITADHFELLVNKFIATLKNSLKDISKGSLNTSKEVFDEIDKLEYQSNKKRIDMFINGSKTQQKLIAAQQKFEEDLFKKSTEKEKSELLDIQLKRIVGFKEEYKEQQELLQRLEQEKETWRIRSAQRAAETRKATSEEEKEKIRQKHKEEKEALDNKIKKTQEYLKTHSKAAEKADEDIHNKRLEKAQQDIKSGSKVDTEFLKANQQDKRARALLSQATQKNLQEEAQARKEKKDDAARERREQIKFRLEQLKALMGMKDGLAGSLKALKDIADEGFDAMMKAVEQPISTFFEYQAKYEARLQGSQNEYDKMMTNINRTIGLSPFIKQQTMVKNLQEMIDKGINYNVELRAYIATVSEGIASTFDAFDSNLLRLIRIQQNDSTAARLGIEAALTKFFNNMYSDTTYLGQGGPADQVTAALLEASAQLTHQGAAEMEFVAQKWLGSLYSLGVSGEAVQNIAQGLGYLGSGNIESLSGNETLISLLAMSATRGGTSISDILTGGLTADKTDRLLQGMVEYLAEIANNTDANNVTKSSIAQVFGLTNTDLRSIMNLSQDDINTISKTNINYGGALAETASQLTQIATRTHLSQMITNVMENAQTGAALTIGGNPGMYAMAKALSIVSSLVGDRGLEIPGIQAMGTGTASGIDILSIAKAGILGTTFLSTLIGSINSLAGGGLPKLSSWKGYEQALVRGSGLKLQPSSVQSGFSESAQYNSKGSSSTSDLGAASMQSAKESAIENQNEEDKKSAELAQTFYEEGLKELQAIHECIQKLTAENSALKVVITPNEQDANANKFKLSEITDEAVKKLTSAFTSALLGNLSEDSVVKDGLPGAGMSLAEQIASELNGLSVHINNDWFDDANQRAAMGGI